jgi:hypothetical protein
VKATALQIGHRIAVPGRELHDDLGGLTAEIRVAGLVRTATRVGVIDAHTNTAVWFDNHEEVQLCP